MASLSFLLGMVPSTEKVETADDTLRADYKAFKDFENSDELKQYLDLEAEVKSNAFKVRKKRMKKAEYRDSEEFRKETEYRTRGRAIANAEYQPRSHRPGRPAGPGGDLAGGFRRRPRVPGRPARGGGVARWGGARAAPAGSGGWPTPMRSGASPN